jgi:hypothetical protein
MVTPACSGLTRGTATPGGARVLATRTPSGLIREIAESIPRVATRAWASKAAQSPRARAGELASACNSTSFLRRSRSTARESARAVSTICASTRRRSSP